MFFAEQRRHHECGQTGGDRDVHGHAGVEQAPNDGGIVRPGGIVEGVMTLGRRSLRIGPGGQEHVDDRELSTLGCLHERRAAVLVAAVDVDPLVEALLHLVEQSMARRLMQIKLDGG